MATTDIPVKTKSKRSQAQRPQTAAELARTEIPGDGPYLVASIARYPNQCLPSPVPGLVADLILQPFQETVIDQRWLESILLMQAFRAGTVALRFTTIIPQAGQPQIDEELTAGLDAEQVGWVRELCHLPLAEQFVLAIKLAETLGPNGLPGSATSKVTKSYLKTQHRLILRAARDLESRCQKRPELLEMLDAQITKIEAL